jgi:hypothetical protein
MRQFGDTLVWLGLILVVAAVVYFTPRLASYVSTKDKQPDQTGRMVWRTPIGVVEASSGEGW